MNEDVTKSDCDSILGQNFNRVSRVVFRFYIERPSAIYGFVGFRQKTTLIVRDDGFRMT